MFLNKMIDILQVFLIYVEYIKPTLTFLPTAGHPANVVDLLYPKMPLSLQTFKIRVFYGNFPLCICVDSSVGIASLWTKLNASTSFNETLQQGDYSGGAIECL
jgi:hypothetical protein